MADFLRTANDWDLAAIIRGGGGASAAPPPPAAGCCQLSPFLGFDEFGFGFEASEGVGGAVNELEELYKPFVVVDHQQPNKHESSPVSSTEEASPCSSSFVLFEHDDDVEKPKEVMMKRPLDSDLAEDDHALARSSCKRRKSKHKIVRVVHRGVAEDGVLMDKWNWRKYGQKAIKGSPHPRSYYRCSSSGGCQARKHVEQSKDNPDTCIVTYIAEHTHSPPTRRHAQAGRKITKFSTSATRVVKSNANKTSPCSTSMTWTVSEPSVVEDGAQVALGMEVEEEDESCGLGVLKDLFGTSSTSFDHDYWSILDFDSFFSTSVN